jgi:uncharacterized cupredoxin-like copper-binding protein
LGSYEFTHLKMEHSHMNRFPTLSFALTLIAVTLAACAGQPEGASATAPAMALTVEAKDFQFIPAAIEVRAGQPVRLTLQNTGTLVHDFSIMEIPMEGAPTGDTEGVHEHDAGSPSDKPELHVAAAAGASAAIQFTPATAGSYSVICTVAGHKEAGMIGTLIVKAP